MTESDNADALVERPARVAASLRRAVLWVAALAFVFAAACALGVFFGIAHYRVVATQPPVRWHVRDIRIAQIWIVERAMLMIAFVVLGRALLKYATSLRQAAAQPAPEDVMALAVAQTKCWQGLIWVAMLYTGWQVTMAFVTSW